MQMRCKLASSHSVLLSFNAQPELSVAFVLLKLLSLKLFWIRGTISAEYAKFSCSVAISIGNVTTYDIAQCQAK